MKSLPPTFPRLGAFFWSSDEKPPSYKELLQKFVRLGLTTAQIGDPYVQNLIDHPERRADFVKDFQEAGVSIAGIACYRNIVSVNPEIRRKNLDAIKAALELAPELGCFAVATETGTFNSQSDWSPSPLNSTPAAWRALLESTEELLATATRAGSILAYEGYVNNVAGRIDLMQSVLDIFPTRHLGVVLDPYNYISRALLPVADKICEEFLNAFADRFVFAHLKDVAPLGADGEAAENDRADLIGTPEFCTGVFPQQTYLRFLRSHRPDLAAIFEHLPMDHIPAAIQKFQALTGGPIQKH